MVEDISGDLLKDVIAVRTDDAHKVLQRPAMLFVVAFPAQVAGLTTEFFSESTQKNYQRLNFCFIISSSYHLRLSRLS